MGVVWSSAAAAAAAAASSVVCSWSVEESSSTILGLFVVWCVVCGFCNAQHSHSEAISLSISYVDIR